MKIAHCSVESETLAMTAVSGGVIARQAEEDGPKLLMRSALMALIVPLTGTRADLFGPNLCGIESPRRVDWQPESVITMHWIGFLFGMDKRTYV